MKKFIFLGGILVVGAFLAWTLRPVGENFFVVDKKQDNLTLKKDDLKQLDISSMQKKVKDIEKQMKKLTLKDEKFLQKYQPSEFTNILQEIDISDVDTIKKMDGVEPVGAVLIKRQDIYNLQVGDSVELPLLGSSNYRFKVTDKKVNPSGSVTVSGNLLEDGRYSVVITQGDKSAYASITTPDGAYEIESVNEKGYIYSVTDIENKRVDHSHSDAIDLPNE